MKILLISCSCREFSCKLHWRQHSDVLLRCYAAQFVTQVAVHRRNLVHSLQNNGSYSLKVGAGISCEILVQIVSAEPQTSTFGIFYHMGHFVNKPYSAEILTCRDNSFAQGGPQHSSFFFTPHGPTICRTVHLSLKPCLYFLAVK